VSELRREALWRSAWLAVGVWCAVILTATTVPLPDLEGAPRDSDKLAHLLLYAPLGFLLIRALRAAGQSRGRAWLLALMAGITFAAFDEWHQQYFARTTDFQDWLADAVGLVLGAGVWLVADHIKQSRSASHGGCNGCDGG
jgi:VanZ family protein